MHGSDLLPSPLLAAYCDLIEQRYGMRLSERQVRSLCGLLEAKSRSLGVTPAELYTAGIAGRLPEVLDSIAGALAIGETHFFRVAPQVDALRGLVLPDLLARRAAVRSLRCWSAGCATGEEPYTLAMLLREQLTDEDGWRIEIEGTDLNRDALEAARRATYREWSFRETPGPVRQAYFAGTPGQWQLNDAIRRMVRFSYLNLTGETPWLAEVSGTPFDLILCRNVTIYFSIETAQRLYSRLAAVLAIDGWLVLGPSDPAPGFDGPLAPVYWHGAVLWRRRERGALPPSVPGAEQEPGARRPAASAPKVCARSLARGSPAPKEPGTVTRGPHRTLDAQETPPAQQNGPDPNVCLQQGLRCLDRGDLPGAIDALRRATFLDPAGAFAQFSLGRALLATGDPSRAAGALLQARRLISTLDDSSPVPGAADLAAGDLRHAIERQLALLVANRPGGGAI